MIDIKAIREAAEKAEKHFYNERRQSDFRRITDRKTVIALCNEIEKLRKIATYATHADFCVIRSFEKVGSCNCGLSDAMKTKDIND